MLLTVGELAQRCGLTVRTLHHYHAIGLLAPSLRSGAGYRLYDRAAIERLHRIQALRQLGLSLADIGNALSGPQRPQGRVDAYRAVRAGSYLRAGQERKERVYVRTRPSDDAGLRANRPGPKGCLAQAAKRRCVAWPGGQPVQRDAPPPDDLGKTTRTAR